LRYRLLRIVGVGAASALMLWLGCAQLLSQAAGAEMLEKRAAQRDAKGQLASVEAALRYRPYDHNFRQLHVQAMLRSGGDKLTTAREGIEKLRRERPHDTLVQWLWIELLRSEGKNRDAIQELEILRVRDPHDPKAILWTAEILVQLHQSPAAIVILYKNPQMRPHLALALRGLADFADKRGDTTDAALLRMEETFITVLDQMIARRYVAAQTQWKRFSKQMVNIDGDQKDPRTLILAAALYLSMNERAAAENLAAPARSRDPLSATHAALMEPVIEGLRDLPGWRELLPVTAVPR